MDNQLIKIITGSNSKFLSSDIACLTNPLKLSNNFKERDRSSSMTDKTIYNYLGDLQDDFMIEKVEI